MAFKMTKKSSPRSLGGANNKSGGSTKKSTSYRPRNTSSGSKKATNTQIRTSAPVRTTGSVSVPNKIAVAPTAAQRAQQLAASVLRQNTGLAGAQNKGGGLMPTANIKSQPLNVAGSMSVPGKFAIPGVTSQRGDPTAPISNVGGDLGGSGTSGAETGRTPIIARPAAPVPEVVAPSAPVPSRPTPVVTGGSSGQGSGGGAFRSLGRAGNYGTFGQLQRQRQNRGPMSSLSMTPELLKRLAAQRFSRQ